MTKEEITAAMKKLRFEAKWVTPEEAKAWLDGPHIQNRSQKKHNIDLWSHEIKAGYWMLTGDTIRFADTGELIDGQNRLKSIIKANEAAPLCILRGIPYEAYKSMDQGTRRTAFDVLTMSGFKNSHALSSVLRAIILYQKGVYRRDENPGKHFRSFELTPKGITEYAEKNPETVELIIEGLHHLYARTVRRKQLWVRPVTLLLAYYLFYKKSKTLCEKFFEEYAYGGNDLPNTHPIIVLKQKLMRERTMRHAFMSRREELILFIYAWNAVRQDKKLTTLTISDKAPFPTIL